ncbi:hypothetical protein AB6735_14775 [Mucilaginibacter sp. RCC_168]|uniref:hypothetical protein n=1 Tax=Mucilaginibacter sp. RCC_168 TaxID=3239221 RepID=UPI003523726A
MGATKPITVNGLFKNKSLASITFFTIVILLLLPNLFTPLRLNTDGIRYLKIMEYLIGNLNQNSDAAHDFFPHGYPWFLLALNRLHLLSPLSITFINIVSILLASYLLAILLKIENSLVFIALIMISAINVKQFTLPIADELFTLLFLTSIYLWTSFFKKHWFYIVPALAATLVSLYVRTAGIALVIGILLYWVYLSKNRLFGRKKLLLVWLGCFIIAFAAFVSQLPLIEKRVAYINQLNLGMMMHHPASIFERLAIHFKELGEIMINIPYSKLSTVINPAMSNYLLIATGLLMCFILYKVVIKRQLVNTPAFWVFTIYLLMIFIWPFYDARFLTPLVSLLIYSVFYYFGTLLKSVYIKYCYAFIFTLFGFLGIAYSDALSLSNTFFLKHYGTDATLTDKYRIHFNNQLKNTPNPPRYNIYTDEVLFLLEKYDGKPLIPKVSIN